MDRKRNTKRAKGFVVHVLETLTVDFVLCKRINVVVHLNGAEPVVDISNGPGERVACGDV